MILKGWYSVVTDKTTKLVNLKLYSVILNCYLHLWMINNNYNI